MRSKTGTITSTKMTNTIVINVDRYVAHDKYQKRFRISKKFYAHVPEGHETTYNEGDTVTIYETRPMSKLKRWTVVAPAPVAEKK